MLHEVLEQVPNDGSQTGSAPGVTASVVPLPNAAGWNNSDVTVTFACQDSGSGIQTCPPPQTVTAEGINTNTATAADPLGNTRVITLTVRIDRTAPSITAVVAPPLVDGAATGPVTVTFTCADSGSGVDGCPTPRVVDTEGTGQIIAGTEGAMLAPPAFVSTRSAAEVRAEGVAAAHHPVAREYRGVAA